MAAFRARFMPLLAALLIALPLGATGGVQYFCHGMGRLMPRCCCPSGDVAAFARSGSGPRVESRPCCERLERASTAVAPSLREPASFQNFMSASALAQTPTIPVTPEVGVLVAEALRAREPPPRGPPIFLQNCSLLI
jgi:hypothetical protein